MTPKLLLVSLRDAYMDSDRVMPPLGVMALQSYMLDCGIDSAIENDFDLHNLSKYREFTHIGISCMTPQKNQACEILHAVKKSYPEKNVIIGGPHANFYLQECLVEPFDHIVIGDGELALKQIISGKTSERIINIPVSEEEMNRFSLPYREPSFLNQYEFLMHGFKATTILTAKGCPMNCAFCEHAGTKTKLYNSKNVGRQIDQAKAAGFDAIMFFDDIFCLSKKRVKELSREIVKREMPYRCFAHARTMTADIADILASTGCIEIGFGTESGSQKILDNINKKTTVRQNMDLVEICNERHIKVKAFLMLGLPGETPETVAETADFLDFLMSRTFVNHAGQISSNDFDLGIYFPYKGTAIRDAIDNSHNTYDLFLDHNPDQYKGVYKGKHGSAEAIVRTNALSSEEIASLRNSLYHQFKERVVC
jgi:radical SAM superfamily enzyme YgiQ (UPF0313 family)